MMLHVLSSDQIFPRLAGVSWNMMPCSLLLPLCITAFLLFTAVTAAIFCFVIILGLSSLDVVNIIEVNVNIQHLKV